jgi:hypothetical protein
MSISTRSSESPATNPPGTGHRVLVLREATLAGLSGWRPEDRHLRVGVADARDRRRRGVVARGEALFGAGIGARMLQHFGRAATLIAISRAHRTSDRGPGVVGRGRTRLGSRGAWGVSPETVHKDGSNIITKLHVSDRSGLRAPRWRLGRGRAGLNYPPPATWCQETRVPSSMIIRR